MLHTFNQQTSPYGFSRFGSVLLNGKESWGMENWKTTAIAIRVAMVSEKVRDLSVALGPAQRATIALDKGRPGFIPIWFEKLQRLAEPP